jgi:hypothetical protein
MSQNKQLIGYSQGESFHHMIPAAYTTFTESRGVVDVLLSVPPKAIDSSLNF